MARLSAKNKSKSKPKTIGRMSKGATKLLNVEGFGTELQFDKDKPLTPKQASAAFNWYNNTQDDDSAKKYLSDFLEEMERYDLLLKLSKVEPKYVFGYASIAAWIARLVVKGYTFVDHKEKIDYLYERLEKLFEAFSKIKEENRKVSVGRSDYQYYSDRVVAFLNEAIDAIDPLHVGTYDYDFNAYSRLMHYKLADFTARKLAPFLREEFEDAFPPYEDALTISIQEPEKKLALLHAIVQDCEDYSSEFYVERQKFVPPPKLDPETGEPVQRRVRKKKVVTPDKKVEKIQYLKEYEDYDLVSVDPKKIVGAQELWVFNVRYEILQVYRAYDDNGLDVKGTTILNYDEEVSSGKRCGRHSVKYIEMVKASTKLALKNVLPEIKSVDIAVNGRLNEHCILLRVVN